jgi:hypothetical protein
MSTIEGRYTEDGTAARGPTGTVADQPVIDENDCLDREHQRRFSRVASYDRAEDRRAAAEDEIGRTTEEIQELNAEQDDLGNDEHLAAIERSRWRPYRSAIRVGSRLAWMLDAGLWASLWFALWNLWRSFYEETSERVPAWLYLVGIIAIPIAAWLCAKTAKGLGQHVAVTTFTNPGSVEGTISRQMRIASKTAISAILLVIAVIVLLLIAQPSWASWLTYLNSLLMLAANVMLGLSAGVGTNVADILEKPARRDAIDCAIDMKGRLRRRLRRFLGIVFLAAALSTGHFSPTTATEPAWGVAVDITDSMDPAQRDRAIDEIVRVAPERVQVLGVTRVFVVKFTSESRLSEMAWVPVPTVPALEDCSKAKPARSVVKGLLGLSPALAIGRHDAATTDCLARRGVSLREFALQHEAFQTRLRSAMRGTPRADVTTHIAPTLRNLVTRPYVRALDVVTDGIDLSGQAPESVHVPDSVAVLMIITRPNPDRRSPTVANVLAAADAWERVDGISVTTVSEYRGIAQVREAR